ncbi:MAG: RimK family alpha-L-glutamate ligase, partial [Desulfurococcaceae archaeon]
MSTKIAVIHYRTNPTESSRELLNAIEESGHIPVYVKIHEIDALLGKDGVALMKLNDKLDIDGGVVRSLGFGLTLEQFFKRIGVLEALETNAFIINKAQAISITRDKWRTLLALFKNGIRVPDTVVTENPFTAMRFCEKWGRVVI